MNRSLRKASLLKVKKEKFKQFPHGEYPTCTPDEIQQEINKYLYKAAILRYKLGTAPEEKLLTEGAYR